MAQTGYTPILIYSSSTASNTPSAANLTNSTLGSELAINITDGKLFYKDNGGSVQVIAWKVTPTSAGGTGLTSYTAGDMLYYATGTTLSKLAIGTADYVMTSSGTAPQWSQFLKATAGGTGQTSYTTGDLLYASSSTALSKLADVATGNALISGGVGVAPSWGKIGLTTHVSGTLPTANGGTNLTSFTANGIMYASSTSALTTSSNLTYDGSTVNITNANLKISDGNRLIMGASDPQIYGDTGVIKFRTSSTDRIGINTAAMYPLSSGGMDLGTSSLPWGNLYFSNNLIQGTAAKGINFTANSAAAGMTSQLLNWYEEGTWTPTLVLGAGSVTYTSQNGRYTRIGRVVVFSMAIVVATATTPGSTMEIGGLPFTPASTALGAVAIEATGATALATTTWMGNVESSAKFIRVYTYSAGNLANPGAYVQAGFAIQISGTYEV